MQRQTQRALCAALLAAAALASSCGQRGPLSLPPSAQPIQRVDPNAAPAQPANGAPVASPERTDEEKTGNER
jgi:predicted small lipoprotein YifL